MHRLPRHPRLRSEPMSNAPPQCEGNRFVFKCMGRVQSNAFSMRPPPAPPNDVRNSQRKGRMHLCRHTYCLTFFLRDLGRRQENFACTDESIPLADGTENLTVSIEGGQFPESQIVHIHRSIKLVRRADLEDINFSNQVFVQPTIVQIVYGFEGASAERRVR